MRTSCSIGSFVHDLAEILLTLFQPGSCQVISILSTGNYSWRKTPEVCTFAEPHRSNIPIPNDLHSSTPAGKISIVSDDHNESFLLTETAWLLICSFINQQGDRNCYQYCCQYGVVLMANFGRIFQARTARTMRREKHA